MKHILILIFLLIGKLFLHGQDQLTLKGVILSAQSNSPKAKLAQTQADISYYQFLTYKSEYRPQISFYGNAPVYSKTYYAVTQPDGSIRFLPVSQNFSSIGFSLSQQIALTGGEISLNTDLSRFDNFKTDSRQYSGTPFFLRLSQPLFAYNALSWRRKIEPLKYEESKRQLVEGMENIAQQVTKLYFDVLTAQVNIQIATSNLENTKNNYEIEKRRVNLGMTTEDKLLQLELQMLQAEQELKKAMYDSTINTFSMAAYTGLKHDDRFWLHLPEDIPSFQVNADKALEYARKYRPEFIAFQRKMLEANSDVARAKAEKQQVNILATYGYNNVGDNLKTVYRDPNDQQTFSIGFNIPLVDWGRRKARYNTAKAIEKLTAYNNELDEINYIQELTTLIENINLLKSNIVLARKTDSVAQRRYIIANNLYQVGKLSITDLNIAQSEKDNARRSYLSALRTYWDSYYFLRRLTLFDFEQNKPLYLK